MKVDIAYTCVSEGTATLFYITRFASTLHAFPAGSEFRLVPTFNGGEPKSATLKIPFVAFPSELFYRWNDGWDIGGYIEAAHKVSSDADVMVCLGQSVYFHRWNWLAHIIKAWEQFGEGMYGILSSFIVRPHFQTTAFVTSPRLLREYPHKVTTKAERYEFEHGKNSFLRWVEFKGLPARLVTWDGTYSVQSSRLPNNIIWKGDQSNCLVWCNHTENYVKADPRARALWGKLANGQR